MKIKGGWQDQYATTFGGFSWIEFRQNEVLVNPLQLPKETRLELEYNLMLFRLSGTRSSSVIQEKLIDDIQNKEADESFVEMIGLARKNERSIT